MVFAFIFNEFSTVKWHVLNRVMIVTVFNDYANYICKCTYTHILLYRSTKQ